MTLAAGSRFIAGLKAARERQPAPSRDDAAETVTSERRSVQPQPPGPSTGKRLSLDMPTLPVLVDGRVARLLLPPQVRVVFDDGQTMEVPTSCITADETGDSA